MESTGQYWRPVWNILEDHFEKLLLVNPQHIKAVSSVLCKRFRFSFVVKCLFLAPQADGGCGKVGIPLLDFHFFHSPPLNSGVCLVD